MSSLCKPVYVVNALPKLRSFSSERMTYHFRKQWTTVGSCGVPSFRALPECGIVLEILPGKFSKWDNVPFSVSGILSSTISGHFCGYKREDAVQQGHEGHISIYTWPCLGSGRKVCLVWKTWSPSHDLLRVCSREVWKQLYGSSLPYQPKYRLLLSVRVVPWVLEQ